MEAHSHDLTSGFGLEALRTAFEKVQNPDHWKGPISAWISMDDVEITRVAVDFFTATQAEVREYPTTRQAWVRSVGYWKGPAA